MRYKDLCGEKFTDWSVIRYAGNDQSRSALWECLCKCGAIRRVKGVNLVNGRSTGCGCSADKRLSVKQKTHAMSYSAEYRAWVSMKQRCENPSFRQYMDYGGRGIRVCDEWSKSFDVFYRDMGSRPAKNRSLDRINNDGNYAPGNCRWATRFEQSRNHRHIRKLTYGGETLHVADWAKKIGISQQALQWRLNNWAEGEALSTPISKRHQRLKK